MGGGISKGVAQAFFAITGLIQLPIYAIFLFTPGERLFKGKLGWGLSFALAVGLAFTLSAANIPINDCEGQNCDQLYRQIIMNILPIIVFLLTIAFLYTSVDEGSSITGWISIAGTFVLLASSLMYTAYAVDFRGVLCMCDPDSCSLDKCKADLPQCTIDCL